MKEDEWKRWMLRKNDGELKKNKSDVYDSGCMAITALVPAARAELKGKKRNKS